ncbi:hypothetical protein FB45DRAFT_871832 [Roridomyces roridus]|uniref:Uncharacterized protein n=1 Tax=Roridomyces roridus TaxID=1738132 RepID=A0AAD7BFM4_9AGAR|nr:hypothetical protein FB45DRAFT_871832 [Roridomyces roridus]
MACLGCRKRRIRYANPSTYKIQWFTASYSATQLTATTIPANDARDGTCPANISPLRRNLRGLPQSRVPLSPPDSNNARVREFDRIATPTRPHIPPTSSSSSTRGRSRGQGGGSSHAGDSYFDPGFHNMLYTGADGGFEQAHPVDQPYHNSSSFLPRTPDKPLATGMNMVMRVRIRSSRGLRRTASLSTSSPNSNSTTTLHPSPPPTRCIWTLSIPITRTHFEWRQTCISKVEGVTAGILKDRVCAAMRGGSTEKIGLYSNGLDFKSLMYFFSLHEFETRCMMFQFTVSYHCHCQEAERGVLAGKKDIAGYALEQRGTISCLWRSRIAFGAMDATFMFLRVMSLFANSCFILSLISEYPGPSRRRGMSEIRLRG